MKERGARSEDGAMPICGGGDLAATLDPIDREGEGSRADEPAAAWCARVGHLTYGIGLRGQSRPPRVTLVVMYPRKVVDQVVADPGKDAGDQDLR